MKRWKLLIAAASAASVAIVALSALTGPSPPVQAHPPGPAEAPGAGRLDGLTFVGQLGPIGRPGDVEDTLVFANGMFVSEECEVRCNYPASPYYTRIRGDALEFVSETRCPHKDATIIWRGTVSDGVLRGESVWTLKRWYWTVEHRFWFEGRLVDRTPGV